MLITADWHLGNDSDSPPGNDTPTKANDTYNSICELVDVAKFSGCSIVVAGDVFNTSNPPAFAYDTFLRILNYAKKRSVSMHFIPGNHDIHSKYFGLRAMKALLQYNIKIHTTPSVLHIDGEKVCIIPHMSRLTLSKIESKYKTLRNYIDTISPNTVFNYLISHVHVNGVSDSFDRLIAEPGNALLYVPKEWPKFKIGFFGHIHKAQSLSVNGRSIIYPGSPIVQNFGEVNNVGCYVYADGDKVIFKEFKTPVTKYFILDLDLSLTNHIEFTGDFLEKLKGMVVKVRVLTDDYGKINECEIKKKLNKVCYVARFEKKLTTYKNNLLVEKPREPVTIDLTPNTLLNNWLRNKPDLTDQEKNRLRKMARSVFDSKEQV